MGKRGSSPLRWARAPPRSWETPIGQAIGNMCSPNTRKRLREQTALKAENARMAGAMRDQRAEIDELKAMVATLAAGGQPAAEQRNAPIEGSGADELTATDAQGEASRASSGAASAASTRRSSPAPSPTARCNIPSRETVVRSAAPGSHLYPEPRRWDTQGIEEHIMDCGGFIRGDDLPNSRNNFIGMVFRAHVEHERSPERMRQNVSKPQVIGSLTRPPPRAQATDKGHHHHHHQSPPPRPPLQPPLST